jgi:DNA-binding MarR family transcriptional regulator
MYDGGMSAVRPGTDASAEVGAGTGTASRAGSVQALDPRQLGAYFVLTEAVSLLQHQVEQQLHAEGNISYVQFQLLARLAHAHGPLTMTQLADGVVYSRSGLTYQAGLLESAGLITRAPSPADERATLVTITDNGRALVDRVLPGHIQVTRRLLFDSLTDDDLHHLGDIMTRVRDHMRAQPPRSAAPRKRRPGPTPAPPDLPGDEAQSSRSGWRARTRGLACCDYGRFGWFR